HGPSASFAIRSTIWPESWNLCLRLPSPANGDRGMTDGTWIGGVPRRKLGPLPKRAEAVSPRAFPTSSGAVRGTDLLTPETAVLGSGGRTAAARGGHPDGAVGSDLRRRAVNSKALRAAPGREVAGGAGVVHPEILPDEERRPGCRHRLDGLRQHL